MDVESTLKWGIKNSDEIKMWDDRITIPGEYLFFKGIKNRLKFKTKILALLSDVLKMQYLIYLII